ncbi:MAG: hypothetical protein V7744_14985 [Pseudomonadales bacterium]
MLDKDSAVSVEIKEEAKASTLLKAMGVSITAAVCLFYFYKQYSEGYIIRGMDYLSQTIGIVLPALLVVLVYQIGKRYRNSQSRWRVFTWTQFVFLLGQVIPFLLLPTAL